jgi:acyl carrier protein
MKMEDKIKEIINIVLEKNNKGKIEELNKEASLRDDLGMDSLDLAELTVRIEDEYDIDIFEDGIIDKVGEIIEKISKRGLK